MTSSQLRAGLGITGSAADWRAKVLGSVVELGGVVGAVGLSLRPNGPGVADRTAAERCANCATSLPYLLVGAHTFCARCSAAGKAWGASLGAVGTASLAFHSSAHGTGWRNTCRRMDYWWVAAGPRLSRCWHLEG